LLIFLPRLGGDKTLWGPASSPFTDAIRAQSFFAVGTGLETVQILVTPLAAWIMVTDAWLPIWIGFASIIPAFIIAAFIPETRHKNPSAAEEADHSNGVEDSAQCNTDSDTAFGRLWRSVVQLINAGLVLVRGNVAVMLLLLTLNVTMLGKGAQEVLLQFARKKFDWSWSQV
jgi:hypothetical protein